MKFKIINFKYINAYQREMSAEQLIRKAYYDPEEGFIGIDKLYRKLKSRGVSRDDIRKFLKKQEVYQVNKKNNRKAASYIPRYPLQQFQIDLIYLDDPHLNQAAYGLCAIDSFTKKADVQLMKRRTKDQTVDAMLAIFERMGLPDELYSDEGSEFTSGAFKAMCEELSIKHILTIRHASIVERFNRTIKEMLNKYLQSTNSKTITNVLPKIVRNYNNSFHSSIGMAPSEVNQDNMHVVQINLLNKLNRVPYQKLMVGDKVRVQVKPKSFVKGYKPKFSKQIYEIDEKGDGYYITSKDDRKYLKSNLQLVSENEINPEQPDYEGTAESRLRKGLRRKKDDDEMEEIEEEEPEPVNKRSVRERKPASYLEDSRYGRIKYS